MEVGKDSKGWKAEGSTELPERWPTNGKDSRPICHIKPGEQLLDQPHVVVQKESPLPAESTEGALDGLQEKLNDNLAELKELLKKNPACYINPKTSSIINRQNKIATMKDRRYCACDNVTFVRDAFYCSNCKRITSYRDDGNYDRYGYCNVCRQVSFHRWLEARKNVEETARINARIDELYAENESLKKQIQSIKNSRSRR